MALKRALHFALAMVVTATSCSIAVATTLPSFQRAGPGRHILGLDISRYQHAGGKPINFVKMAAAGVDFLWINGGNTLSVADSLASKYYRLDRRGAQAEGIYTGFYYFVHLPNTSKKSVIVANARNQADKVIKRIDLDGGLNQLDMPIALDIESTCTQSTIFGICVHSLTPSESALWVTEWNKVIQSATGRTPVIYSFRSLLHGSLGKAKGLKQNPLWLATAGVNPATPRVQPSLLKTGCSTNVWTTLDCQTQWTFWQYSSSGNGRKYGIAQGQVDLDIFRGTPAEFANLQATGLQVPITSVAEAMTESNATPPVQDATPQTNIQ